MELNGRKGNGREKREKLNELEVMCCEREGKAMTWNNSNEKGMDGEATME